MSKEIQILIADNEADTRAALRDLLEAEKGFIVTDETGDGLEVIKKVRKFKPDVVVLDLIMPHMNGLEVARRLHKISDETKIIILSVYDDEGFVLEALTNGVAGYVLNDGNFSYLIEAIRTVVSGRRYLSPPLADRAIAVYQKFAKSKGDIKNLLTRRERQVFQMTVEGKTKPEIASKLRVNLRTVEAHCTKLMNKLNIGSKADLIRYAIKRSIIQMNEKSNFCL